MISAHDHIDSWYRDSFPAPPIYPTLEGRVKVDVCVVGGGYTGLSAALSLAERGYRVALLEASRIGYGASGRNGGQLIYGLAPGMDRVKAITGFETARAMFAMCEEAKQLLVSRAQRYGFDCDLTWGYVYAAAKDGHIPHLRDEEKSLREEFNYHSVKFLDRAGLQNYVRSPRFPAGLFDSQSGHLHPLKYAVGLGQAAAKAGVMVFEQSPALRLERAQPARLATPKGEVEADWVILAVNAFRNELAPELMSRVMPVGTYIGATEILDEATLVDILPQNVAVCDSNFVLDYFRRAPKDNRLLFGGRVSYSRLEPLNLRASIRARMVNTFPSLKTVKIEKAWGGYADITMNRMPHVGRLKNAPNILFAQGFSGHGVAVTGIMGKLMAEAVMGQNERFDLFARLRHAPFPGGRMMRTPALVLAMLWYRLRDWL